MHCFRLMLPFYLQRLPNDGLEVLAVMLEADETLASVVNLTYRAFEGLTIDHPV